MGKIQKASALLRYAIGRRGLMHRVAATTEHKNFLENFEFATVLDAGANKGQFSLAVCCYRPGTKIIAFEPLSRPAQTFERVFAGYSNVTLRRIALGACEAESEIHVSRRDDSSSLLAITDVQTKTFQGTEEVGTERVSVAPLDHAVDVSTLEGPILLKIDVQGYELELLKGAVRSLGAIEHIYCELSFLPFYEGQPLASAIIGWLADRGFEIAGIYHISYNGEGRAAQADFHFRKTLSA